ncbi:S-layer homology domain-containing protein [Saccharibacillus sp. CPCC 101409]|uniref:S-layer homology domain-containing protein n=1 Tax=Saccharibacillus sp. CPCC 101409 TaxID=3058041 RepID=UPI002674049B|nr:S-layer homology domain-containing protein [Saccharibacillus sp. CPCC 101409]MDO3412096.1 S-layer homology domain-containing protein [Saccharibacillus sp. CPCC 101409]
MSNMSEREPITDKKISIELQGGEQKGMKKIVTLALSTAMALSMFASVSSAATMTTQQKYDALAAQKIFEGYPNGETLLDKQLTRAEFAKVLALLTGLDTPATSTNSYQDKNYSSKAWYQPYVEAVTKAGYMQGTSTGAKKLFSPNDKITVQEIAATLVRAAKLDVPTTGINNDAAAWAKGEVQAAINAGLVSANANFKAAATRGLLVDTAYAYLNATKQPTVASYVVENNGGRVVFTLSNGEKVTVDLKTPLVANTATNVTFTYDGREYTHSVTYAVTTATQVQGVAASNLKEVEVTFNGTVDEATATDVTNYSFSGGDIDSAVVVNGNVVRLTLADGDEMDNQESYTLTVTGVKAGSATINSSAITFRPLDNVLPTVSAVTGLGTKAVKVTFSEPVRNVNSGNFTLDGAAFNGSVTEGATSREYILRPYTAFTTGTHSLVSSLVEDYNGLRSLSATNEFTVAVDATAPTATEIQGTLERVVVTFSEEIDPSTVVQNDFYWLNGSTKVYSTGVNQIAGNKYEVWFAGDSRLPASTTSLYIDSVSDFSGNANTVKQYTVNASVDQTRPEVSSVTNNSDGTVTVRFNKAVNVERGDFTVTNSSGTVQAIRSVTAGTAANSYVITFYTKPVAGTYTLAVKDVQDTTALKNTIAPYSTTFTVGDTARPKFEGIVANAADRTVTVSFSKPMDPATLTDRNNYALSFSSNGTEEGSNFMALPSSVTLRTTDNNRSVVLQFPTRINGAEVTFPTSTASNATGTVRQLTVTGVKDASGNILENYSTGNQRIAVANGKAVSAVQTGVRTIEVTFGQGIQRVAASDFSIPNYTITSAQISSSDSKVVTLTTSTDLPTNVTNLNLTVRANNQIRTVAGTSVDASTQNITTTDKVAPVISVTGNTLVRNNDVITVPFSEALVSPAEGNDAQRAAIFANDFTVINLSNNAKLTAGTDYYVRYAAGANDAQGNPTVNRSTLEIVITQRPVAREYSVQIVNDARYLQDAAGNLVKASALYTTSLNTDTTAPTLSATNGTGTNAPAVVNNSVVRGPVVITSPDADTTSVTLKRDGVTVEDYQLGKSISTNGVYTASVTDSSGNVSTVLNFTIDSQAPEFGNITATGTQINVPVSDANLDLTDGETINGFTVTNGTTPVTGTLVAKFVATAPTTSGAPVTAGVIQLTLTGTGASFGSNGQSVRVVYDRATTGAGAVADKAGNVPALDTDVTIVTQ